MIEIIVEIGFVALISLGLVLCCLDMRDDITQRNWLGVTLYILCTLVFGRALYLGLELICFDINAMIFHGYY